MSLVSLLATTTLITLANSTPMIYTTNQRAKIPVDYDHLLLMLLLNHQDFGQKTKPLEPRTLESLYGREKRIGSLSIVNSVDVLRERVLLELARRKAMEDQRQISENRRLLDSVGKRSGPGPRELGYRSPGDPRKTSPGSGCEDEGRERLDRTMAQEFLVGRV
ncbi:PREDICTED: uncharacterized protein LOC105362094 [Ceratosolen solmsi marchali]|uniref:Uncharacterized protein LOC105362094 n=1 Tax=Ceratosolen solmsi marchali TaxID=326594 RepID=A0AAJ6YGP7_9HYME|nr:PREDICTED: uncharacterized protein LOC105362094 [Ceratosolen solmsi marchali]XP_011497738.1 PREDICTED: uncharacterized protein LOC105362094 [Ceratosolen solmsi marchali]